MVLPSEDYNIRPYIVKAGAKKFGCRDTSFAEYHVPRPRQVEEPGIVEIRYSLKWCSFGPDIRR